MCFPSPLGDRERRRDTLCPEIRRVYTSRPSPVNARIPHFGLYRGDKFYTLITIYAINNSLSHRWRTKHRNASIHAGFACIHPKSFARFATGSARFFVFWSFLRSPLLTAAPRSEKVHSRKSFGSIFAPNRPIFAHFWA